MFKSKDISVKLVHYNDSKFDKGEKADRHARIGTGLIGFKDLYDIGIYCVNEGIHMVVE